MSKTPNTPELLLRGARERGNTAAASMTCQFIKSQVA